MTGITKYTKYLDSYNDNFYVHCVLRIENKKLSIHTNVGLQQSYAECINEFVDNHECKNIIYTIRSKEEPYSEEYPSSSVKNVLEKAKKNIVFFNQQPWPEAVPNFSNTNLVIRFGFDDGCDLDKLYNSPTDTNLSDGTYHFLISKNKTIELKQKTSFI